MEDLQFYGGTECHFCHQMEPLVQRLEKEYKVKVERIETWHNAKNAKMLQDLDEGECGGVPYFYNKKTGNALCGAVSYEVLVKWATGK